MRYEIVFAPAAVRDLRRLTARNRATIRDRIERHLRHRPEMLSRSRIKRLRGFRHPQFRLRVDEFRIFYDIVEGTVEILAILPKSQAYDWLAEEGDEEEGGPA